MRRQQTVRAQGSIFGHASPFVPGELSQQFRLSKRLQGLRLVYHQWKTWIQYKKEYEIETALEYGMKFLYQCSRWARSNWRSNWTSLVKERYVITQQPWCNYALHLATFTSLAFVMFIFTKMVKRVRLWWRHRPDLICYPVSVLFGYFHGLIKIYALLTLNMSTPLPWERPDDHDSVLAL
ncbi:glycosyltransferase family 2 protein [Apiospora aurea]|uniref:Glycosyltransferase family 2 protein n=1 Tax=Apiospora aurea TaxID=335848 RepID=A0ABR1PTN9_9PEZI